MRQLFQLMTMMIKNQCLTRTEKIQICLLGFFPSMDDFRLAVRQHAIVKDFELATSHSDTERFRGHCASLGCPWIIRARTQHGGSVRVLNLHFHCSN